MKNKIPYASLLLWFIFWGMQMTCAQQITVKDIEFNALLPSYSVYRVYQDKEGFIWFGTENGLYRCDAYRIISFKSDLNNPTLLTNNEITCFTETAGGDLLIGTRKGLNQLDKSTYEIKPVYQSAMDQMEIRCMITARDGSIWIGADGLIFRCSPDFSSVQKYDVLPANAYLNHLYEDNGGQIWMTSWRAGLYKYNPAQEAIISYPGIGEANNPFNIFQDNKNQYWISTWGDGLYLFDPEKNENDMYQQLSLPDEDENTFFSITQDDTYHYIWAMSMSGLHVFNYESDGSVAPVDVSPLFKDYNNIYSEIIKDKDGNLWIGTYGEGVLSIQFNRPVIENHLFPDIKERTGTTTHASVIYEDKDGDIWFHQNRRGLAIYNSAQKKVQFYADYPALKRITGFNLISCITDFRSLPGEIWIAPETEEKIYSLTKDANHTISLFRELDLTTVKDNPGMPRYFYEDKKNNIWIVTTNNLFVKPFHTDSIKAYPFGPAHIRGITEDTRGNLWVCCKNKGVYQILSPNLLHTGNPVVESYSKEQGNLPSNNIEAIHADMNGKVWIGTKEGHILVYDIIEKTVKEISQKFRIADDNILNILSDDFGHIWIATNTRIIEYNPANDALWFYSDTDGVSVNSFARSSFFKSRKGKIYFGGNKGISVFTPSSKLSADARSAKAIITDIKINNQSVYQQNINRKFNIKAQTLTLEPEDNNIEINFSSLDYAFPSKISYAYKMDGINEDWIFPEHNRQFAIYSQLSKGHHTFYIKATDEHNLWSDQVTELKIYKRPAFYESNLAYGIYILLFLLVSYTSFRTIKNRIKLRNELRIAQIEKDKTEELTQTKLKYFTNISHDFLTPLTIISCMIDDMEITKKENITHLDTIRSNIYRLRRLLQQILDFKKVESGNMKLRLSYGDMVMFIKDTCYTNFLPLMKKKNIRFTFNANPNQIYAHFDADKTDKIIFNLLSNAFKYTPEGGEVSVRLEQYIQSGRTYLRIRIEDTGVGIAPEDLKHVFTRFYNNNTIEASETNGIGLSLTKDLVELHHGTIEVESKINAGTTFTLSIPIDKEVYEKAESEAPYVISDDREVDPAELNDTEIQEVPTVLLVEDNDELRRIVEKVLSKNYSVLTATNGVEALSVIADKDIDIVISDVMMPEMDGLELCRKLKQELATSHIPVILLTAKSSTDDRIDCYNAGADGYISKPFDLKLLEARINNFIANKKSKQKEFKADVEINISTLEYPSLDEEFLTKAIQVIEDNLSKLDFDVNTFAENLHMSKSSLYRKLKTMTGLSPIEFIRNIKLKHACQFLKNNTVNISEVAYLSGFSDPKYFTTCFRAEFGMTPREYQKSIKNNL